jgi:hypothetical protein
LMVLNKYVKKCLARSNETLGCVGVGKIKPFRTV